MAAATDKLPPLHAGREARLRAISARTLHGTRTGRVEKRAPQVARMALWLRAAVRAALLRRRQRAAERTGGRNGGRVGGYEGRRNGRALGGRALGRSGGRWGGEPLLDVGDENRGSCEEVAESRQAVVTRHGRAKNGGARNGGGGGRLGGGGGVEAEERRGGRAAARRCPRRAPGRTARPGGS